MNYVKTATGWSVLTRKGTPPVPTTIPVTSADELAAITAAAARAPGGLPIVTGTQISGDYVNGALVGAVLRLNLPIADAAPAPATPAPAS